MALMSTAFNPPPGSYCRHCDLFTGYGAVGVVRIPVDRDQDWLCRHCWLCERSIAEIAQEARNRESEDTSDLSQSHRRGNGP